MATPRKLWAPATLLDRVVKILQSTGQHDVAAWARANWGTVLEATRETLQTSGRLWGDTTDTPANQLSAALLTFEHRLDGVRKMAKGWGKSLPSALEGQIAALSNIRGRLVDIPGTPYYREPPRGAPAPAAPLTAEQAAMGMHEIRRVSEALEQFARGVKDLYARDFTDDRSDRPETKFSTTVDGEPMKIDRGGRDSERPGWRKWQLRSASGRVEASAGTRNEAMDQEGIERMVGARVAVDFLPGWGADGAQVARSPRIDGQQGEELYKAAGMGPGGNLAGVKAAAAPDLPEAGPGHKLVGLYTSPSGKVWMQIEQAKDGRFRYAGDYGGGSGLDARTMAGTVRNMLDHHKRTKVGIDFLHYLQTVPPPASALTPPAGLSPRDLDSEGRYTIWTRVGSGRFVIERSYRGVYIKEALANGIEATWSDPTAHKLVVFPAGVDPNGGAMEASTATPMQYGGAAPAPVEPKPARKPRKATQPAPARAPVEVPSNLQGIYGNVTWADIMRGVSPDDNRYGLTHPSWQPKLDQQSPQEVAPGAMLPPQTSALMATQGQTLIALPVYGVDVPSRFHKRSLGVAAADLKTPITLDSLQTAIVSPNEPPPVWQVLPRWDRGRIAYRMELGVASSVQIQRLDKSIKKGEMEQHRPVEILGSPQGTAMLKFDVGHFEVQLVKVGRKMEDKRVFVSDRAEVIEWEGAQLEVRDDSARLVVNLSLLALVMRWLTTGIPKGASYRIVGGQKGYLEPVALATVRPDGVVTQFGIIMPIRVD